MDGSAAASLFEAGNRWTAPDSSRAEFRLLGHLEVGNGNGAQAFGGPKQRALLAFLLLHSGEVVTTERLVDAVWADEPPPTATAIVYGYVRKLRSALEATSATLNTRSAGYVLEIPGGSLDIAQFERLAGLGRQALRSGDAADARRLLGSALALWRGQALDGLDGEGFIHAERSRLESLRLTVTLGRIDADLRLGAAADVVEELEDLAREHPLDEGIRGQLMMALYQAGNQAEALAVYQDIRRTLAEELGLDPSRTLQELEGAILRQDPSLDRQDAQAVARPIAGASRTTTPALRLVESTDACPFVGLATFGVQDADVFFGRERLVSEMVVRLVDHGFLGVVGPSGSGKSSVVRAGLVPAIEAAAVGETSWVRAILRPGAEPLRELDRVVFAALSESQRERLPAGQDPLVAAASVLPDGVRLLVIVDQFEEVFTSVRDAVERSAFIESLVGAARAGMAAVVLAMRADFYGRCAEEPSLAEQLAASQVLVGPMGRDEYRSVIERPAARAGLAVEPALVERLLDEVEGQPGGLPLLATALVELWERRDGRTIRLSALAASGGISGAVGRLAENAYGQLTDTERSSARSVFLRLISGDGEALARRRVPLAEFDIATDPDVQRTLSVLTAARVLTRDRGTIEVAHEALFREWPRLEAWIDEDQESRRVRTHLTEAAHDWDESGRTAAELYRGARLAAALDWAGEHATEVNDLEREFVGESQAAREAEEQRQRRVNRRLRVLLIGACAGLAVAVAAIGVAEQQRRAADQATIDADAQRLGAQALVADTDLGLSMLLARQGVALDDTPATRNNLASALDRSPAAISVWQPLGGGRLGDLQVSDDGSSLLTGMIAAVAVVDTGTGKVRFRYDGGDERIALAADGRLVAAGSYPLTANGVPKSIAYLKFLDGNTGSLTGAFTFPMEWSNATSYSRDLMTAYGVSDDGRTLTAFDIATSKPVRVLHAPPGTKITVVAGMPAGHLLTLLANDDSDRAGGLAFWGPTGDTPLSRIDLTDWQSVYFGWTRDLRWLAIDGMPGRGQVSIVSLTEATMPVRTILQTDDSSGDFSPDGSLLVTGSTDGSTRVWDIASGQLLETMVGHTTEVNQVAVSERDGRLTAWTIGHDGDVIAYDIGGDRRVAQPFAGGSDLEPTNNRNPIPGPSVALSPDGRMVALARTGGVGVFDASSHALITRLSTADAHSAPALAWSGDGSRLAVAASGAEIAELFDTATWKSVRGPLPGPLSDRTPWQWEVPGADPSKSDRLPNLARAVAFSPDSRTVAVGTEDGKLWTWDAVSGDPAGEPVQLSGPIHDLAFDPLSGALAAAVNPDSGGIAVVLGPQESVPRFTVRIDTVSGQGRAGAVAFSPDGTLLATGGGTSDVRFFDPKTGAEVGARVAATSGWVLDLDWTPDGKTLVSSGTDGKVQLIDALARSTSGLMPSVHGGQWVDAAVSPDGQRVIASYDNGDAYDWSISPADWSAQACRIAGRTLTADEWAKYLPGRPYAPACAP